MWTYKVCGLGTASFLFFNSVAVKESFFLGLPGMTLTEASYIQGVHKVFAGVLDVI
jgi:hypothetical protein